MAKILWLASWFPNEYNPLAGDFIKRHAEALSLYKGVHVIHVEKIPDNKKDPSKIIEETDAVYPNLSYVIKYYSVIQIEGLERIFSFFYSLWLYHSLIKMYIQKNGKPEFLHLHIAERCGWVALYYKWFYHIPYIITEQHTIYLPQAAKYEKSVGLLNSLAVKLIYKKASFITPVSETLANALKQKFGIKKTKVIYNVVNTSIFYPVEKSGENAVPAFIHISTLTPQKNPEQMLEAFALLKHEHKTNFILHIVGPQHKHLTDLIEQLRIHNNIVWHRETSQPNLAALMHSADAFVLYSRYETFGCVNIEAIACGLPVIVSDIPVFREYLKEGPTAWFAKGESPADLAAALHSFINSTKVLPEVVSRYAAQFDYETIGGQIEKIYNEVFRGTQN
jgi:glycosyltransferase involved in cell wall biosynthesis